MFGVVLGLMQDGKERSRKDVNYPQFGANMVDWPQKL